MYLKRVLQLGALFWASTITSSLIDNEFGYLSDLLTLLFAALLIIAIPVSALLGIKKHGLLSLYWPLPPTLCVLFLYNFHWIGVQVSEGRFQWQLPEYATAVNTIKVGNIELQQDDQLIDIQRFARPPGRAKAVSATRCGQQNLIVRFMVPTRGGALGPHWGYIYDDCSDTSNTASETAAPTDVYRPHETYYHIQGPWYEFYRS